MSCSWSDFLILVFAVWQIVETYRHGSLFDELRATIEIYEGFWAELLSCMFCLSHWVAGGCVLMYMLSTSVQTDYVTINAMFAVSRWFMLALAVTRGAQLLNDVFHDISRTPK